MQKFAPNFLLTLNLRLQAVFVGRICRWMVLGAIALTPCPSNSRAEERMPIGTFGPHYFPIPSPSLETKKSEYMIGNYTYSIPRNFLQFAEKGRDGALNLVSMEALLPEMRGLAQDNVSCFRNFQEPCNSDVVTVGLKRGEITAYSNQIANIKKMSRPGTKWACGYEYYEDIAPEANHSGFRWLFKDFGDGLGASILRCPKEGSLSTRACDGSENTGDGNSFYYVFRQDKMCSWNDVRFKVRGLIRSFEQEERR
jgi:hypothetical protein